jgi:outer membrane receptor protein involved in Fe transport
MRLRIASLLLILSAAAFAQTGGGVAGISGVVRDQSGALVPKAKVVISTESLGVVRTLATNDSGLFTAPALVPGPGYKVTVTATGFAPYEAKDLDLRVGQNMDLQVSLAVGQTTSSVEVTAAPMVEDTKTDVSAVVDSRSIQELPINGRRVDSFVLLTPDVHQDGTFGLLSFRGVAGQNSFLVDGNDTTNQFYNENAGRTRIASQLSQDAVQEFQVVSANFSAEYGRAMGGVVNTVTKSGGNDIHGTAYWFFRNRTLNARDPFAAFNPHEYRHQTGASIGGPLKKDKLFYFLNVDFTRRNFPMVDSLNVVSVNPVTQTFIGCGTGSATQPAATPAQCAAINTLLPRFYGLIPRTLSGDLYFGKLDYHFSDRNTFSASFNFLHNVSPSGIQTGASSTFGSGINGNGDDSVRVRNGRFSWVSVPTSSFVNEFRWGWSTDRQADTFDNSALGQGLGFLQVSVNGATLGPAAYLPRVEPNEQRFQFVDNATWTKGTHTIKFGADIATTEDFTYFIQNQFGGYTYQTVNAFALDYSGNTTGAKNWQRYIQTFGNPVVDASINDYGFYLEDQWRATGRLTVNAGVRYEYAHLPQPKIFNHDYPQTGRIHSSPKNFAPRLGLAYRLNDKTVIRAGFGMFYARFQGGTIDNLFTNNGIYQTAITLNSTQAPQLAAGPVFPSSLSAPPTGASVSASSIQFMVPNLRTPYSEQYTLAIERQVGPDWVFTLSYIGSHGVQLYGVRDLNLPALGSTTFTYTINDVNGSPAGSYTTPVYTGTRPDTRYGGIYMADNGVTSSYNGLALQARKRFSHGLQAAASYTWSHQIDDGQSFGESTNNLFLTSANYWLYNGNYKADKGSGSLDQRHRFVLSWIWAPTFTNRTGAFYKYIVNNWQLSNITAMQSGQPSGSPQISVKDTPVPGMFSNFTVNGSGLGSRVPFLPINSLYLPRQYRADARLTKIIPIGDRYKLGLTFDCFNISNSWSPTGFTSSQAFTEAKGILTPTPASLYIPSSDGLSPDGTQARRMQVGIRFVF